MAFNLLNDSQRGPQDSVNFRSTDDLLRSKIAKDAVLEGGVEVLGPIVVGQLAEVGQGAVLAAGVKIGNEAIVKEGVEMWTDSSTGDNSTLNARVKVFEGASVGNRSRVAPETVIPANTRIDSWKYASQNPRTGQVEQNELE